MSISTKVVSLNPVYGEVYSIQYYVIMFVSNLRQVSSFLRVLYFPLPIKLTATIHSWNIVESGVKYHKSTNPINYRKQISLMNMIYVASQNPIYMWIVITMIYYLNSFQKPSSERIIIIQALSSYLFYRWYICWTRNWLTKRRRRFGEHAHYLNPSKFYFSFHFLGEYSSSIRY